MRHARLFSIMIFVAVLSYGAFGFFALPLATFQGDLTRMGLISERLFGWTKPQPAVEAKWMRQAAMREADILVIGDSFSDSRVWQTVLARRGWKIRTETWETMHGVCADFMPWLHTQGFSGKYVVFESIERDLESHLRESVACRRMQYHASKKTDAPRNPPPASFDVNHDDYSGKFSVGIRTLANELKYQRLAAVPDFKTWELSNKVSMVRVANGCELFSHARCNEALFLVYDKPREPRKEALQGIETVNARLNGIIPIWAFVPNKSTAYLFPDKQFWNEAERRFHAPNLLNMTRQAILKKTVDIYPANNTHYSTEGYLLMGEEILKALPSEPPRKPVP